MKQAWYAPVGAIITGQSTGWPNRIDFRLSSLTSDKMRWQQLVVVERLRVSSQRPFVVRAAIDVMKYGRRQSALRDAPEIHDVVAAIYSHDSDYAV